MVRELKMGFGRCGLIAVLLSLLSNADGHGVDAQTASELQPFYGQNHAPSNVTTAVYVSVGVEKITNVDDNNFLFEGIFRFSLQWKDASLMALKPRKVPLSEADDDGPNGCHRECFLGYENLMKNFTQCCDHIWLPTIFLRNLYEYYVEATGAPMSNAITVDYDAGQVVWQQTIRASFYAEYDFRAFPFDRQALVVEFEARMSNEWDKVELIGSSIVYDERPAGISEDVNGWKVEVANEEHIFWRPDGSEVPKQIIRCQRIVQGYHSNDQTTQVIAAMRQRYLHYNVPTLQFVVLVSRVSDYYVISSIIPICLIIALVFPVYFIKRSELHVRLQLLITLYLTLAASQFFLEKPKSDHALLPDLLGLLAYLVLTISGLESVLAYFITRREYLTWKHKRRLWQVSKPLMRAKAMSRRSASVAISAVSGERGYESQPSHMTSRKYPGTLQVQTSTQERQYMSQPSRFPDVQHQRSGTEGVPGAMKGVVHPIDLSRPPPASFAEALEAGASSSPGQLTSQGSYQPPVDLEASRGQASEVRPYSPAPQQHAPPLRSTTKGVSFNANTPQGGAAAAAATAAVRRMTPSSSGDTKQALTSFHNMSSMVDDTDRDLTVRSVFGIDVNRLCCGLLYQMCGAFDCLVYSFCRLCRAEEDPEREKTVAYFLDVWALVILGSVSIVTTCVLVLLRWQFSFLTSHEFAQRYQRIQDRFAKTDQPCVDFLTNYTHLPLPSL